MGSKFVDECLKAHNDCRKKHGVPPLKHNKEITAIAQRWADHLAKTGSFQHSKNKELKGQHMGENIAMKWTSSGEDFTGVQVTEQWYDEIKKYNFRSNSGAGTGHFTQVVWRDSREFGVGKAQGKDGKWLVVGNYLPAGNVVGQHSSNVYPLGGGTGSGKREEAAGASKPGLFGSFFGQNQEKQYTSVVRETNKTDKPSNSLWSTSGNSTSVSRRVTTETVNGRTVTKTVITETTVHPDGSKTVHTREEVNESHSGTGGVQRGGFPDRHGNWDEMPSLTNADFRRKFEEMSMHSPQGGHTRSPHMNYNTGRDASPRTQAGQSFDARQTDSEPQKVKDFIKDVVKAHNAYRKKHGKVGDLKSNPSLCSLAQKWADHLAATGTLQHSSNDFQGERLGENVAMKWGSGEYTGQEVTDQWYSEVKKYDFNRNDFTAGTGHFTQVVWKGSKEIGVGMSVGKDNKVVVVCNYLPAGNMMGQFSQNVFR